MWKDDPCLVHFLRTNVNRIFHSVAKEDEDEINSRWGIKMKEKKLERFKSFGTSLWGQTLNKRTRNWLWQIDLKQKLKLLQKKKKIFLRLLKKMKTREKEKEDEKKKRSETRKKEERQKCWKSKHNIENVKKSIEERRMFRSRRRRKKGWKRKKEIWN